MLIQTAPGDGCTSVEIWDRLTKASSAHCEAKVQEPVVARQADQGQHGELTKRTCCALDLEGKSSMLQ